MYVYCIYIHVWNMYSITSILLLSSLTDVIWILIDYMSYRVLRLKCLVFFLLKSFTSYDSGGRFFFSRSTSWNNLWLRIVNTHFIFVIILYCLIIVQEDVFIRKRRYCKVLQYYRILKYFTNILYFRRWK